jgi:hypothetical protein
MLKLWDAETPLLDHSNAPVHFGGRRRPLLPAQFLAYGQIGLRFSPNMLKKHLEYQSCFPGSIGQRSNASMVLAVTAVEADFFDASLQSFFRNRLADDFGRILVSTVSDSIA